MKSIKRLLFVTFALFVCMQLVTFPAKAVTATPNEQGVTVIHLDEYNGYFSAHETLAGLKAGKYKFIISNKADKLVGFQIQDLESRQNLDMFPLEPGQTKISEVTIGKNGARFRCPINPTPWIEIDNVN